MMKMQDFDLGYVGKKINNYCYYQNKEAAGSGKRTLPAASLFLNT